MLRWNVVAAVCLGYAALAAVTIWSYSVRSGVPVPFLAAGVYWGGLLLTGVREWRLIVPTVFAIQLGFDLWIYTAPPGIALIFALSKTLEGLLGVAFLRFGPALLARRYSNRCGRFLIVGGGIAPMLLSLFPAAISETPGSEAFFIHWLQWWLVQASGVVLVAPLLLLASQLVASPALLTRRLPEVAALAVLALTLLTLPVLASSFRHPASLFLAMPLLFLIAARFGLLGAIVGNTLLGAGAIAIIWLGVYSFPDMGAVTENVATLCVFLLANCGASLIIGASASDRENSVLAAERAQGLLRELVLTAQEAEDDYRKQIAQLLHDDLGQNLALIRMRLDILLDRVDEEAASAVRDIRDTVDEAIASGRSITSGVASTVFEGDDLGSALQQLLYSFQEEMEIDVEFRHSGKLKLDRQLASKLFRCARELLLNVLKHASADKVVVDLGKKNGVVRISIADNGKGFDPRIRRNNGRISHFGLSSCRNTLESLGGSLQLKSSPGNGTTAIITAPGEV